MYDRIEVWLHKNIIWSGYKAQYNEHVTCNDGTILVNLKRYKVTSIKKKPRYNVSMIKVLPYIEEMTIEQEDGKREHTYPMFELVESVMIERVANVMTKGAKKYGMYNWRKFNQEQIDDIARHGFKHFIDFMSGDNSEDHLANACCNAMMSMYFESIGMVPTYRKKNDTGSS